VAVVMHCHLQAAGRGICRLITTPSAPQHREFRPVNIQHSFTWSAEKYNIWFWIWTAVVLVSPAL